jgi:hypothetical protein
MSNLNNVDNNILGYEHKISKVKQYGIKVSVDFKTIDGEKYLYVFMEGLEKDGPYWKDEKTSFSFPADMADKLLVEIQQKISASSKGGSND